MENTNSNILRERQERIQEAIALGKPDRVPIWFQDMGFFPAKYVGITYQELLYDTAKLLSASKKTVMDFELDMYFNPVHSMPFPGSILDGLQCKQFRWPGGALAPQQPVQFVEGEYMRADEYDHLLHDPSDFALRIYLPRIFRKLEVFGQFAPFSGLLFGAAGISAMSLVALPEFREAIEAFYEAELAMFRHAMAAADYTKSMAEAGFPCSAGAIALAPFDFVSDLLRGMKGTMLDMYRQPEKLLVLIDMFVPMMVGSAIALTQATGNPRVFLPLHRGADGFMSPKQFETFYWPSLKKVMLGLIGNGLTPCPFFEGDYTTRLKYLTELPKGKVMGSFDRTDIYKVKEALGDIMCISGLMPLSLLQVGTPDSVRDYTKRLIDVVGKGGGFIMGPGSAMDEAKPELVRVWVEFTKEYGV
jgi:hypothetical protein